MAVYVYGLMCAADAAEAVRTGAGPKAPALDAVQHNGLAAVVSALPDGPVKLQRHSVVAHSDVLQAAFAHGPVLPLRFGTAFADEVALQHELLAPQRDRLLARLQALSGKAEMQVKAVYLEEQLLQGILAADSRLAKAAQSIRGRPAAATHFERIRLGEAIAAAVQRRREVDAEGILRALRPLSVAVAIGDLHHERAVLNAAFLIEREQLEEFDGTVERLSEQFAQQMQFKLIGPLPAHSFAEHEWEREEAGVSAGWA
jgi:hypothetical protein